MLNSIGSPAGPVNPFYDTHALRELDRMGGHLIPCIGKVPVSGWKWQRDKPTLDYLRRHLDASPTATVGLIPRSVGCSVLDVDTGNPSGLWQAYPPLSVARTPSGGAHGYYRDSQDRRNRKWSAFGCGGDLRSASGYVVVWQPVAVVEGLGRPDPCPFPEDLFEAMNVAPPARKSGGLPEIGEMPTITPPKPVRLAVVVPDLPEGSRHVGLLHGLLRLAGRNRHIRGNASLLLNWAAHWNARLCEPPLPIGDVWSIAHAAAAYSREWSEHRDDFLAKQSERGRLSGLSRRKRTAARDAEIVQLVRYGLRQSQVADLYGLKQPAVSKIIRRSGVRKC